MADPLTIYDFVGPPRTEGKHWEDNVYILLKPEQVIAEEIERAQAAARRNLASSTIYDKILLTPNSDTSWHKQIYSRSDTKYSYKDVFLAPAKIVNNTFTLSQKQKFTPTSGDSIYIRPNLVAKSYSKMLLSCQDTQGDGKMDLKAYIKLQENTIEMIENIKNKIYKNIVRILNIIYRGNPNIDSILQAVAEKVYKNTQTTIGTLKAPEPHTIDNPKAVQLIKHICVFPNNKTEEFILPKFETFLKLSQIDRDHISSFRF